MKPRKAPTRESAPRSGSGKRARLAPDEDLKDTPRDVAAAHRRAIVVMLTRRGGDDFVVSFPRGRLRPIYIDLTPSALAVADQFIMAHLGRPCTSKAGLIERWGPRWHCLGFTGRG